MKHLAAFTIAALLPAACNHTSNHTLQYIAAESAVTAEATYIPLTDIAENITYVPLETTPESLIKNVTGFVADKNMIYLNNAEGACLKFTPDGKFAGAIGTKGRGPSEYLSVYEIFSQEGKIYIYDVSAGAILAYDPSGTFISKIKLDGSLDAHTSAALLPDGEVVTFTPDKGPGSKTAMLSFVALNKESAGTFQVTDSIPHINPLPETANVYWYFKEGQFVRNGENVLFKCTLNDTIYRLEQKQGKHALHPQYILQLGKYAAVPDARLQTYKKTYNPQPYNVFEFMQKIELLGETDRYLFYSDVDREEPCYFYDKKTNTVHKWRLMPEGKETECKENAEFYIPLRIDANGNLLGFMRPENENDNPVLVIAQLKN